jgi:predicted nucleic acid-binding protein
VTVFADTSALVALLDRDDRNHESAAAIWADLLSGDATIVSTSYVLIETYALAQRRLGLPAVRTFTADFVPLLDVVWVDATLHAAGVAALFAARRRALSLVDCVSFEVMRQRTIDQAFAFDPDFRAHGFRLLKP